MDAGLFPTLFSLGLLGGFLSGLLGIGGGIIMVPLVLYVPSALGVGALTMKTVAGITSVQSFFGALSGAIGHKRYNRISVPLAYAVGGSTTVGSLAGSIASAHLSSETLLMVFAAMAIVAAVMMVLPKHEVGPEPEVASLQFNKPLAIAVGLVGRLGTSQIPYLMSAVLVAGVLIGVQLGSVMSQKTPRRLLRGGLSARIAATA